jgi:hypothetical protein
MRHTPAVLAFLALGAHRAHAQERIPVVDLPPASAKASRSFGAILGVRQVAGGTVLVNDAGRRQITLLDSTLALVGVVMDSTAGGSNSYGPQRIQLIPYFGDSSLFADFQSQTLLVLDGVGHVARVWALPNDPAAMASLRSSTGGVDATGRLVYRSRPGTRIMLSNRDPAAPDVSQSSITQPPDSAYIVRADLDARRIDTIGRVLQPSAGRLSVVTPGDGSMDKLKRTINPLQAVDEWAVLSDGTIAFVRGHDYHIDWIHPDGTKSSTAKLPFDWKRLTDDDKQHLVDSARTAENAILARAVLNGPDARSVLGADAPDGGGVVGRGGRGGGGDAGAGPRRGPPPPIIDFVPLTEIADYYPAIRAGAALADRDGNLWILPTTSAQSQKGELIYDVINPKAGLFERVRVPAGRSVAGFGKGGVVYLMSGDRTNGFYLERTRLDGKRVIP